ncbi:MAG: hypothetical protein COX51_04990, partial [Syntrophobacteraceae bacterium CG23_combo_of_CG06-09_8_20_14_all_50_8]
MVNKTGKVFTICSIILIISISSAFASNSAIREAYLEGRRFMQESQWTKALEKFQSLEKDYVLLSDYVLYDMAVCYEKSGEKDKAIAALK